MRRVMVVEDEADIRHAVAEGLQLEGKIPIVHGTGGAAVGAERPGDAFDDLLGAVHHPRPALPRPARHVWHVFLERHRRRSGRSPLYPIDVGLTMGVLPFEKLNLEVGFDLFLPSEDPLQLNAKVGVPEASSALSEPIGNRAPRS